MGEIIERYSGEPETVARALVDAANAAGGGDNITAIFVAGSDFVGIASPAMAEARARHSITRARANAAEPPSAAVMTRLGRLLTSRTAFLVYGFVIGVAIALAWR
jgi:hypothetical protein